MKKLSLQKHILLEYSYKGRDRYKLEENFELRERGCKKNGSRERSQKSRMAGNLYTL